MKKTLARWAQDIWYKDPFIGVWLMPFGFLFSDIVKFRKFLYRIGLLKTQTLPVSVIVVGNITVGGTGKTPLIIYLANFLKDSGFKPGIISRGYGGGAESWPQWVDGDSLAKDVGDEALLIAKQTSCPMAVGPIRADAGRFLLEKAECDVILSDDGLQHYALHRTIEIAVIDGERRFGNGYCLPAGPLREPIERLSSVDLIIVNGDKQEPNEYSMSLVGDIAINLLTGEQKHLVEFKAEACHAIAGIGHPERFFKQLESAGLNTSNKSFPDHYSFQREDIEFSDQKPVLMTEKDAVKCKLFAGQQHWYVPVTACPESLFTEQLLNLLREKHDR
ncbi:MAG: tetraacyldisaccharide 4'-kinase [Methylococcales bacterium]|nr:MAG: tetraacyldisaccharide 4'-kinase [Methylococcales bacterium]